MSKKDNDLDAIQPLGRDDLNELKGGAKSCGDLTIECTGGCNRFETDSGKLKCIDSCSAWGKGGCKGDPKFLATSESASIGKTFG